MRLVPRPVWIAALLVAGAGAPHAQRPDSLLAEARTPSTAATLDRVHRGLDADPDDAALLELKLRLEIDGVGMEGVPEPARRQQRVDTAKRLVAVDVGNPLANDILGRDALRTYFFFRDRVNVDPMFGGDDGGALSAAGTSPEYLRARYLSGRFNLELFRSDFRVVDASSPGRSAARVAAGFLERAIATDPAYRSAYEPLVAFWTATGEWNRTAAVAAQAQAGFPGDGELLLWQALAQYRLGDPAAAEATFSRAFALLPPEERVRYEDIADLLASDEVDAYRADPGGFTRAFWNREDVRLLTPANERRAEHYARRTEADLLFGWSGSDGAETRRGRIWARYGAPKSRTQFSGGIYPGDKLCALCPPDLYDVWEYDGFQMVFDDPNRSGEFRTYSPSAVAFSDVATATAATNDDYVMLDRQLRREAPQRTSYAPARRERVPFLATTFRGASGQTDLIVAFGVPLAARPTADAALALRTGVFVLQDGAAAPVSERRRRRASLPASETIPLGPAAVWVGAEALRLAPGAYTLAAEFDASDGAAVGYERAPVVVPGFAASGLQLSGLLLAERATEGASGPVERGGYGLVPLPVATVAAGRPLTVYAEAYGLGLRDGRTDYEVELALVPADDRSALGRVFGRDQRRGVSTQSEVSGSGTDESIVVSLDTSGQPAGVYRLALRIVDRTTGATAEAEREVTLER